MQNINLDYEWNDVALLTDQRAYTFVCKTMLQIPKQTIEVLQEIILADWQYKPEQNKGLQFDGSMTLQVGYLCQQERGELEVTIPLQGNLLEPLTEQCSARLLYSKGQVAGSCLLLEAILQISRVEQLQRSQVILGQFAMEELLELPKQWPCFQDVLVTVAAIWIDSFQIEHQQLQVQGYYQLAAVYENGEQPGERLFAYEQQRPMIMALPVPSGLQELEGVQPYYQNLTAQLLDDRHILLTGEGVLCTISDTTVLMKDIGNAVKSCRNTASADSDALTRQMAGILQQLKKELKRHAEITEQPAPASQPEIKETEELLVPQQKIEKSNCEEVCPANRTLQSGSNIHPSVVNSRGSRRANLSKYMRNLNSSVQTPKSMRNFEIGAEQEQETPPQF